MKRLLLLLLIVLLAACSLPAGSGMRGLGRSMVQCCASLPFVKNGSAARFHDTEAGAGLVSASIFDPQVQLIRTW